MLWSLWAVVLSGVLATMVWLNPGSACPECGRQFA